MSIDFNPADFAPDLVGYTGQGAFRFWCQKVLPIVYDDSLSYYELLNKIVVYLNNVISDVSSVETNVLRLYTAYYDLQTFVNDFFSNLSVDEEINNKLDAMAEDGTLSALIEPFIPAIITDWLDTHITPTTPPVDDTLSISGAAADAKVTGDELKKRFSVLGNLTQDTEGLTPDTVPDALGYYVASAGVTNQYVGKTERSIFVNYTTPAGVTILQSFVLADGTIFNREGKTGNFASSDTKNFKLLGELTNESGLTPNDIPSTPGYYLVPVSVTVAYTGESSRAVFLNFTSRAGQIYLQTFITDEGNVYSRYGTEGEFISPDKFAFRLLGNLTGEEGFTPDTVPNKRGYYVVPANITLQYTGVSSRSIFLNFTSANNQQFTQYFLVANGDVFARLSSDSGFSSITNKSLRLLGNLTGEEGFSPDTVPAERGYYVVPVIVTQQYTGHSAPSAFFVFTSPLKQITMQTFICADGAVLSRRGNSGDFVGGVNNPITFLGNLSADLTPDNVPTKRGYYICPSSVTKSFTGCPGNSVFFNFTTANSYGTQVFFLNDGRTFSRWGNSGEFVDGSASNLFVAVKPDATDDTATDSLGGLVEIYIPYSHNKHIKTNFLHGTRPSWSEGESTSYKEGDYYRFNLGTVCGINRASYGYHFDLIVAGAWDSAIYENYADNGRPSGGAYGTFHGWEKFSRCVIQVDGRTVCDLTPNSNLTAKDLTACKRIDILYWANIYKPGTTTISCNVFKRYTIDRSGIHCVNRFVWHGSGKRAIYGPMGCVSKALTDRAFSDYDYVLYDISGGNVTPITTADNNKSGVSNCIEFGSNSDAKCEIKTNEPMEMYIQNNDSGSTYNKIYFNRHGDVVDGDIWKYEFDFIFG